MATTVVLVVLVGGNPRYILYTCSSAQGRTAAAAAYGRQSVGCELLSSAVLHWAVFRCGRFIIKYVVLTLVFCWPEIPRIPNSPLTQTRPSRLGLVAISTLIEGWQHYLPHYSATRNRLTVGRTLQPRRLVPGRSYKCIIYSVGFHPLEPLEPL